MNRYQVSTQMCSLIPLAHERAVRGAEIAVAGQVGPIGGSLYFVASSKAGEFYAVDLAKGSCNCPDGRAPHDSQGRKLCKHVCAVLLSK